MENNKEYVEDEIDLIEYLVILYKYKWSVIFTVLFTFFVSFAYFYTRPPKFVSDATFFCVKNISNNANNAENNLINEDLVISILQSRMVVDSIVKDNDLIKLWLQKTLDDARKRLLNSTKITVEKGNIIKISVEADSPEMSMKLTNAFLDKIDEFNRKLQLSSNVSIIQIIDRAIVPDKRLPKGTKKNVIMATMAVLFLSCMLVIIYDSFKANNVLERFRNANK